MGNFLYQQGLAQAHNLAGAMPEKMRELQQLFATEAKKYRVFPLDDTRLSRFTSVRPSYSPGRTEFAYTLPVANIPLPETGPAPSPLNRS